MPPKEVNDLLVFFGINTHWGLNEVLELPARQAIELVEKISSVFEKDK